MHTILALQGNVYIVRQLSNRKPFCSRSHPTFSPTLLLMIHVPEEPVLSRMPGSMFLVCRYQTSFLYSYAMAYISPRFSDLIR